MHLQTPLPTWRDTHAEARRDSCEGAFEDGMSECFESRYCRQSPSIKLTKELQKSGILASGSI
jgi:hypothetical protein